MLWALECAPDWGQEKDGDCEKEGGKNHEVYGLLNVQEMMSQMSLDTEQTPSHADAYGRILIFSQESYEVSLEMGAGKWVIPSPH